MPPAFGVMLRAFFAVRAARGNEIGIDDLRAGLDTDGCTLNETELPESTGVYQPVPQEDIPLSAAAQAAFASIGDIETASFDDVRRALGLNRKNEL